MSSTCKVVLGPTDKASVGSALRGCNHASTYRKAIEKRQYHRKWVGPSQVIVLSLCIEKRLIRNRTMAFSCKIDWTVAMRADRAKPVPGFLASRSTELARLDRLVKKAAAVPFFVASSFGRSAIMSAAVARACLMRARGDKAPWSQLMSFALRTSWICARQPRAMEGQRWRSDRAAWPWRSVRLRLCWRSPRGVHHFPVLCPVSTPHGLRLSL
jgi:hypothetical protein